MEASLDRPYARALKGQRIRGEVSGKSKQRYSVIAALCGKKLLGTVWFEGYTDTTLFNAWLEHHLVPELKPGQVVFLDNASFHKSDNTREILETAQCRRQFLPTYSPDLNPIEHSWTLLKARLRKQRNNFQNVIDNLEYNLREMGK